MFPRLYKILCLLICLIPIAAGALDRTQPIELEADRVELDEQAGTSTYSGSVKLKQGNLLLQAEHVIVYLKNNDITRMLARGNPARLNDQLEDNSLVEATATTMDYDVIKDEILMTGEGMLNQNGNILNNDRILYNLNTGTLSAGGIDSQQRVKVILQPADKTK